MLQPTTKPKLSLAAQNPPLTPKTFAESHCAKCACGWVRHLENDGRIYMCLLDRELVPHNLKACNKFEAVDSLPAQLQGQPA